MSNLVSTFLSQSRTYQQLKINPNDITSICEGNLAAACILRQVIYWSNKKNGLEFYKTDRDFADEISLNIRTFQRAKRFLTERGFLEVNIRGKYYGKVSCYKPSVGRDAVSHVLSKHDLVSPPKHYTSNDKLAMPYRQTGDIVTTDCHNPNDKLAACTLSYNTSDITSSSSPTPSEEKPVAIQERKEEEKIRYIMENQNSQGGSPVQPDEAPIKLEARPLASNDIPPVDIKGIADRMVKDWNSLCPVAKSEADGFMLGLHARFEDSFNRSFDEWEKYCETIASSKFLMGERAMSNGSFYKLSLSWALSPANIEKVRNGTYDKDREIPLTAEQREKQVEARKQEIELQQREGILDKIGNSNHPDWVKRFYGKVLGGFGANGYYKVSDNGGASISQEDGRVQIVTQTLEAEEFIEGHRGEIATFLLSLGMKPNFIVKDVCKLRREKLRALPIEDAKSIRKLGLNPISAILEELRVNEPKRKFANSA